MPLLLPDGVHDTRAGLHAREFQRVHPARKQHAVGAGLPKRFRVMMHATAGQHTMSGTNVYPRPVSREVSGNCGLAP